MNRLAKPIAAVLCASLILCLAALLPSASAAPPPLNSSNALATVAVSISSEATVLAAPASGKQNVICAMVLNSDTAGVVVFNDGTAGTAIAKVYCPANTTIILGTDFFGPEGIALVADHALTATLTSATLRATVRYRVGG